MLGLLLGVAISLALTYILDRKPALVILRPRQGPVNSGTWTEDLIVANIGSGTIREKDFRSAIVITASGGVAGLTKKTAPDGVHILESNGTVEISPFEMRPGAGFPLSVSRPSGCELVIHADIVDHIHPEAMLNRRMNVQLLLLTAAAGLALGAWLFERFIDSRDVGGLFIGAALSLVVIAWMGSPFRKARSIAKRHNLYPGRYGLI